MTDATFEEIDGQQAVGPETILLCGYGPDGGQAVAELLADIGRPDHRVLLCGSEMLGLELGKALELEEVGEPAPPEALPRVMVLSGLTGPQIQAFLDGFGGSGLPRPIFASATSPNLGFVVRDLLRELLQEQQAMDGSRGR